MVRVRRTVGMADPRNGGPWEWRTPGMADLGNGGPESQIERFLPLLQQLWSHKLYSSKWKSAQRDRRKHCALAV